MLRLFNTLGRKLEIFKPMNDKFVTMFTCGPSVYQRSHIGNFKTFLFEDILVRYLEYSGYKVKRGMNFTDIEDKALREADARNMSLKDLTEENIRKFVQEMEFLRMKIPDYLPRSSEAINEAVGIVEHLLTLNIAYWHQGNIYFDPLKFSGFGELYGLDMTQWPAKKRKFHKDTYPGMRWNRGDFIIWHRYNEEEEEVYWDTRIGRGRPSWNIQDPSMIKKHFSETLSIYCGGIDNLIRHHDYTRAILESIRPYPMARFWLHCHHLYVRGKKMSKSKGNICYTDTLQEQGYDLNEIRFFLIYGHYRNTLNYSEQRMHSVAEKLRTFRERVSRIASRTDQTPGTDAGVAQRIKEAFAERMDDDLDVKGAFDKVFDLVSGIDMKNLSPTTTSGVISTLREIDEILQVIFQ